MRIKEIIYLLFIVLIFNCAGNNVITDDLESSLNKGIELFNNKKYSKARDQFEFIIYNNPGSTFALKAQYYFAESLYMLENYESASREYDKFVMLSQDSELVARSKFLICKCLYQLSHDYNKDQDNTKFTIDKIQYFLEEYPNTSHKDECEDMITVLRSKLALKEIESGKLYLRLEKYDSALLYFNLILIEYYDTPYYDDALFYIILTYVLDNQLEKAEEFLNNNNNNFITEQKLEDSKQIIIDSKQNNKIKYFFNLIK